MIKIFGSTRYVRTDVSDSTLIGNFADIPLAVFSFFKFWLVDGYRFQLVFFVLCFMTMICNDK